MTEQPQQLQFRTHSAGFPFGLLSPAFWGSSGSGMSWRRISANSIYVLLATAALAVLQWFIMAMIARREGTTALGQYALSQAFAVPASYLAWLSLRQQLLVAGGALGRGPT